MTDQERRALIDRVSQEVANAIRPRLREMERDADRGLGEIRTLRRKAADRAQLALALAARDAELADALSRAAAAEALSASLKEARSQILALEKLYATGRRPAAHLHSTDEGAEPVIILDLHGTLTPSVGFTAIGEPGFLEPPFPGVREALDRWASQGICLHIASGGLGPAHDDLTREARRNLVQSWVTTHGLPIGYVTGKVSARIYYDDRMVPIANGNWAAAVKGVDRELDLRSELGSDGIRRLIALPEQGEAITEWPELEELPPDQPRGLSTRILDVDVHRCLSQANSSTRTDDLNPGAAEAVRKIYDAGYQIHLSCAGFDPTEKSAEVSAQRLAAMRQQVRAEGVPYDQFVTKDHGTACVDDRGLHFRSWRQDLPLLLRTLAIPDPEDEVSAA